MHENQNISVPTVKVFRLTVKLCCRHVFLRFTFVCRIAKILWCGLKHSVASFWVKLNLGFVSVVTLPLIFHSLRKKKIKPKPKQITAAWLGSCSTSPPCGSSKNPGRDPCGGWETSWPQSLVLSRQNTRRDGQSILERTVSVLPGSEQPRDGLWKIHPKWSSCRGEAEHYPHLPPLLPLPRLNML